MSLCESSRVRLGLGCGVDQPLFSSRCGRNRVTVQMLRFMSEPRSLVPLSVTPHARTKGHAEENLNGCRLTRGRDYPTNEGEGM